jgi:hypothetical protein
MPSSIRCFDGTSSLRAYLLTLAGAAEARRIGRDTVAQTLGRREEFLMRFSMLLAQSIKSMAPQSLAICGKMSWMANSTFSHE